MVMTMPPMLTLQRWSSAPAVVLPGKKAVARCGICFDEPTPARPLASLCGRLCDASFCADCVQAYLMDRVGSSSIMACCPRVECPAPQCRAFVPLEKWRAHVPEEVGARYAVNAGRMLSLQCGNCDGRHSLLPDFQEKPHAMAGVLEAPGVRAALERHVAGERAATDEVLRAVYAYAEVNDPMAALNKRAEEMREELAAARVTWRVWMGTIGEIRTLNTARKEARKRAGRAKSAAREDPESKEAKAEVEEAKADLARIDERRRELQAEKKAELRMDELASELQEMQRRMRGVDARMEFVDAVLVTVACPERRATLMLRHLALHPKVNSRCHKAPHCWRCKTRAHVGKTCQEHMGSLSSEVRSCPGCSVLVARGDGCSSLKCPCGRAFRWSEAVVMK